MMWLKTMLEMGIVQGILLLLLGWLMGLFAPIIVDEIRRRRQVDQIKLGIQTELTEVRLKLAATACQLALRFDVWDRPLLEWYKSVFDTYTGLHVDEDVKKFFEELLTLSDEELARLDQQGTAAPHRIMELITHKIPFLDSHVAQLTIFSNPLRNLLMETKTYISILNEQIELSRFYQQKTFDSGLSGENHQRIEYNLKNTYKQIVKTIRHVIEITDKVFTKPGLK